MRSNALRKEPLKQPISAREASHHKIHVLKIAIQAETACHMGANKNDVDYEEFMKHYHMRTRGFFE